MQMATSIAMEQEDQLIERLKAGDEQALQVLIKRYEKIVFRTCIGFVHNQHDAEDLTQEVFIQLYQSVSSFRGDAKLSTWLYRVAVNKSLNAIRSKKNKSWLQSIENFFSSNRQGELQIADSNADSDSEIENKDKAKAIHSALHALPDNQRIAFTLSKYDDLSYAEIAEVMDLSVSSVESLLFRARKNLQKKLIHAYQNL